MSGVAVLTIPNAAKPLSSTEAATVMMFLFIF